MSIGYIETPTLKELFMERIEDMILTGKLSIGERLPTERELEEETHISKTVIHAGLVDLEKKGFVEIIPRKGTFVANYAETGTLDTLNALLRHNGGNMTKKQVDSLYEARLAIEGTSLKKLAENHTDSDIAKLEELLRDAQAFSADMPDSSYHQMAEKLFNFHREVCVLCGNVMFPLILNDFKPIIMAFWECSVRMYGPEKNVHLIKRYLDEIRAGDSDAVYRRLVRASTAISQAIQQGDGVVVKRDDSF